MLLTTTYQSADVTSQPTFHLPHSCIQGTINIAVTNPAPGGGTSGNLPFTVSPLGLTVKSVPVVANDLVWEPVSQQIYLSLVGSTWAQGTSIQALDPTTATLGNPIPVGSYPDRLAVSANSKYLFVGIDDYGVVQSFLLPGLTPGPATGLESTRYASYAMQIAPSPDDDNVIAVIQGTHAASPPEVGGIAIFDIGIDAGFARPNQLCGLLPSEPTTNCLFPGQYNTGYPFNSMAWGSDNSLVYPYGGQAPAAYDAYIAPVNSAGFESVTAFEIPYTYTPGISSNPRGYFAIHYDPTTNYLVGDDGLILDPANMTVVGNLQLLGVAVPDGKLGVVFMVNTAEFPGDSLNSFSLYSYDIQTHNVIAIQPLPDLVGLPVALIRWGTDGLALLTQGDQAPESVSLGPFMCSRDHLSATQKANANTQIRKSED